MNASESESIDKLAEILGPEVVERHEPVTIEGARLGATLRPADGKALGATLAGLSVSGLSTLIRGAGTALGLGNLLQGASVILSTEQLRGVDEFDPGEGVCHVLAGTPLSEVREVVGGGGSTGGWELPLDAPRSEASIGGVLASAAIGPRALGFGLPRDIVLGLEVALTSGDRVRSGGRVVKNVTGYDLNKVFTGSFGSLGVIEGAWLRLKPRPDAVQALEASVSGVEDACALGLEVARRSTARVAALVSPTDDGFRLVVELAGDAPSVAADRAWLEDRAGAVASSDAAVEALRVLQEGPPDDDRLCFRLAGVASRIPGLVERLQGAGAHLLVYPELGLVFASFPIAGDDAQASADVSWAQVAAAAEVSEGGFRLESGPIWAKSDRDVFAHEGPSLSLIHRLKERFDPRGILNPGRFAGRV
jgi:glycolate oxidase FAD binding subunit